MNLAPVSARLTAGGIAAKGLKALVQIRTKPPQSYPAFFVSPDRETGLAPIELTGIHDQLVNCDFLVVIHLDANSARLDDDIDRYTGEIEALLTGWVHPDAEGTATAFRGQQLFELIADDDARKGRVALMMKFGTVRRIRKSVIGDQA